MVLETYRQCLSLFDMMAEHTDESSLLRIAVDKIRYLVEKNEKYDWRQADEELPPERGIDGERCEVYDMVAEVDGAVIQGNGWLNESWEDGKIFILISKVLDGEVPYRPDKPIMLPKSSLVAWREIETY